MVFFICNACGQSVKKAQVEKHYLQQCRQCEVLSCMDCGQDFVGDGYKEHTKCISENEKYGSKKEVSNIKPNKGDVKQAAWLERVREASTSSHTNPKMKSLLNQIIEYPNIPRKKTKFENFLKNSLRLYDKHLMQQAWLIVSGPDDKKTTEETSKKIGEKNEQQTKNIVETDATQVEGSISSCNGKKKRTHSDDEGDDCEVSSKQACLQISHDIKHTEKFKWSSVIKRILREKENNEMSIKKLRKKVIAEYMSSNVNGKTEEELRDKFYKKINSISSLKTEDKRIKLIMTMD
ncbi:uncharacterized protein C16C10.8-like [Antedon mediterranea]|uniref:uncharacterized protein C16C10.8-like n=1 Tax=Antedon mediterranea TaxID=105859 RepID=UPI003AF5CC0C